MIARIRESLVFDRVILWDNSRFPDWKCAGRYMAMALADTEWCYFQDDDVLVPEETQRALLGAADETDHIVSTWGHGEDPDGYDDLPLVCGGAIARKSSAWQAIAEYGAVYPLDQEFMFEADFAVGVLYQTFDHVHLPFQINLDVAQHESRLVNQPWQRDLKLKITERARHIRDSR